MRVQTRARWVARWTHHWAGAHLIFREVEQDSGRPMIIDDPLDTPDGPIPGVHVVATLHLDVIRRYVARGNRAGLWKRVPPPIPPKPPPMPNLKLDPIIPRSGSPLQ
jgi:hypothetical protein